MNVIRKIEGEMKREGGHDFSMTVCNMARKSKGKHIKGKVIGARALLRTLNLATSPFLTIFG